MDKIRKHKRGIIGTVIFHTIVLLLLFLIHFRIPFPPPAEEGILVNFGTSENGLGQEEPAPANVEASEQEPSVRQEKVAPPPTPAAKPEKAQPKEQAMTQDYEKTAAIDAAEKKKQVEELKRKKQEADQLKKAEQERIRKEQAEAEKIRKAEAEALAKAEAERKAREEQQRRINEINSRAQGAFASTGTGPGGKGTGTNTGQGVTYPGGNQGVPTGDPNSSNYGDGGSGNGEKGSGISFSLSGRSALSLPKPRYPGNDEGKVVVKVTVDKSGNVTAAEPGASGTTIMDQRFWDETKQAALKAKFNADNNSTVQQGTITYRFVLD